MLGQHLIFLFLSQMLSFESDVVRILYSYVGSEAFNGQRSIGNQTVNKASRIRQMSPGGLWEPTDVLPPFCLLLLDFSSSSDFCSRSGFDQHKIEFLEKSQKFESVHYSHFSPKL